MKPLYIEISAFGAFGGMQQIDFTKMGGGLFLIHGETGAGKTTIFDAISYALYGKMSGSIREVNGIRSDFSSDDAETYIYMEFLYRDEIYKIRRSPSHLRARSNGNGYVKKNAKIEMSLPDGTILTDNTTVKSKITELLGLTYPQWRQVAMIAQGEFAKCLHADSGERSAIFRNIFNTKIYGDLEAVLKKEELVLKRRCEDLSGSLFQYLGGIKCEDQSELCDELNAALQNKTIESAIKTCELLAHIVNAGLTEYKRLKRENTAMSEGLEAKTKELEAARHINAHILELNKEKEIEKALQQSENIIAERKRMVQKADATSSEINALLDAIKKHDEALTLEKDIASLLKQLEQKQAEAVNVSKEKAGVEEAQNKNAELLKTYKDVPVILTKLRNERLALGEKYASFESILLDINETDRLRIEYQELKRIFDMKKAEHSDIQQRFDMKQDIFIKGQAGILAEGLKENEPCVVCGSVFHPAKAKKIDDMPTEEELKKLKKTEDNLDKARQKAYDNLSRKITEGKERGKGIIKNAAKLITLAGDEKMSFVKEEIEKAMLLCQSEINGQNAQIKRLEADDKIKNEAEAKQNGLSVKLKDILEKERYLFEGITAIKTLLAQKSGAYDEIRKSLAHETKDMAITHIFDLTKSFIGEKAGIDKPHENYAEFRQETDKLKKSIDEYNSDVQKTSAKIDALVKMINGGVFKDTHEMEASIAGIKRDKEQKEQAQAEKWAAYKANIGILKETETGIKALLEAEKQFAAVSKLSKTANGELKGKQKITLEMYVQRAYFNKIVKAANIRLCNMTNGRFELMKKQTASDLRDKTFALDLDVLDNYTGKIRDIRTLSGGESFMAALSLSLSLSDIIQLETGGVMIETMFIDEGFGTLSPEFLPLVIDALTKLSSGDKLIGVISHVNMLIDAIDKQICVVKTRDNGSRAYVNTAI